MVTVVTVTVVLVGQEYSKTVDCACARYDGDGSFGLLGVPETARLCYCVSPHCEFVWHATER